MDFYKGIKKLYPDLPLPQKIKGYLALMRPFTLIAAVVAGFSLNLFFSALNYTPASIIHSLLVGLVLGLLQAGGQALNQSLLVEMEIDKLNGKDYRPTLQGTVSFEEGKIFSFLLFLTGGWLAFLLGKNLGSYAVLITLFAITYSAPPFRVKEKFLWNNLHQAVARGALPVLYVASGYGYNLQAMMFALVLTLWITGAQTSKDFTDVEGDRRFGVETFPSKLGRRKALIVMAVLMAFSFILLNLTVVAGVFPPSFSALNLLAIPSTLIIAGLRRTLSRWENNLGWLSWYIILGAWYLMPVLLVG